MNNMQQYEHHSKHIKEAIAIVVQQYGLDYMNSMTLLEVQWTAGKLWARGYSLTGIN